MLLADVVATSQAVAATRSRKAKAQALADAAAPGRARASSRRWWPTSAGTLRQRRTGLGWRGVSDLARPGRRADADGARGARGVRGDQRLAGAGLAGARAGPRVADLFGRATAAEQAWLRGLVTGDVRQGALDAAGPGGRGGGRRGPARRRTPGGDARRQHRRRRRCRLRRRRGGAGRDRPRGRAPGAADAGLQRPRRRRPRWPRWAASRSRSTPSSTASGSRSTATATTCWSRPAASTTSPAGCPRWSRSPASLPAERFVLDGEALALDDDGRPRPFQETASRTAQAGGGVARHALLLRRAAPRRPRPARLARPRARSPRSTPLVPERHRVRRLVTADPAAAEAFVAATLAAGHEGVVVKDLDAPLRGRPPRRRLGQGQAGAHPRPRRARRRVGQRAAPGLALQHPPRRPRPATGRAS